MLGYSAGELQKQKVDFIFTMATRIFHQTHFLPMLKLQPCVEEIYLTLRRKDGNTVPVLGNAAIKIFAGKEVVVSALLPVHQRGKYENEILAAKEQAEKTLRDNLQLREAKQQLEQHSRQLDRHLALLKQRNLEIQRFQEIFSHDLKEPVRRIHAFANILATEHSSNLAEDGLLAVEKIEKSCARISDLLRILQEFLSAEDLSEDVAPVDLSQALKSAEMKFRNSGILPPETSITLANLPIVEGYPTQLATLFEILIRNSITQAGPGPISISAGCKLVQENAFQAVAGKYRYVDFARITYRDNGPGYVAQDQDDLFQLLRQTSAVSLDSSLAICRKLVENHGGSIRLERDPGLNTAVVILLPIKSWQSCNAEEQA